MRSAFLTALIFAAVSAIKIEQNEVMLAQEYGGVGRDMAAASALGAQSLNKVAADAVDLMSTSIHDAKKATSQAAMNAVDGLGTAGNIASNAVQSAGAIDS